MNIAQELDNFIRTNNDNVFIEAEGKPSRLNNFYMEYNSQYSPSINDYTDGIIVLDQNADKWGLELRLYMHYKPSFVHVTKNTVYRDDYLFRLNDVNIIKELFILGYRIGFN